VFREVSMATSLHKFLWGSFGTALALSPTLLLGHIGGPEPGYSGAPMDNHPASCATSMCHTGPTGSGPVNPPGGKVTATFSSGASYVPGGSPITITVAVTDQVNTHYGFQMTARLANGNQAGHFTRGDTIHQIVICSDNNLRPGNSCPGDAPIEYIEHYYQHNQGGSTTPFTFTWAPPATNVGNITFYVAGNATDNNDQSDAGDHIYNANYVLTPGTNNPPTIVTGGVLNAASFAKGSNGQGTPVAPGSLVSIFASNFGSTQADASGVPFPLALGGATSLFNGAFGPMRDVVPAAGLINVQIPFATPLGSVNAVLWTGGGPSAAQAVTIVAQAPGVFTIPPGVGIAVLVNLTDYSIAGPANANIGIKTHPIARGAFAFFYATGLGVMTPPVPDGDGGSDGKEYDAVKPQVTIGGITAPVLFAGQAPGFPGVYQVNIQVPQNAPTGDGIDMRIISADGTQKSPAGVASISVQ
jgi:uncharacterized protein (TIGR03437 family)